MRGEGVSARAGTFQQQRRSASLRRDRNAAIVRG